MMGVRNFTGQPRLRLGAKTLREGLHDHIPILERTEGRRPQSENRQEERRHKVSHCDVGGYRRPGVHQAYGSKGT